jgi:UDP-N-acetyl-D-glucosamine dehydrogenase
VELKVCPPWFVRAESRSLRSIRLHSCRLDTLEAIQSLRAPVAVIGLGYVGLPLALRAVECGFTVTGFDTDPDRVSRLVRGESPFLQVPAAEVASAFRSGRFNATGDFSLLAEADVILICVPTPLKLDLPDTSAIESAAERVAATLKRGQLVVLESTTYPGTTEELLLKALESSGLKAGIEFHLGFSPERVDPGNDTFRLDNVPKIVGGIDELSTELMDAFYSKLVDRVVRVSSARTAEMAKLLENTYRHVNIALVNEIAILCHDLGIDVWEVIDAAQTKPFGFQAFYPGPGWGGHCIPVDPAYLSWRVRQIGATARFVELAREFNQRMPGYVVQRIADALNEQDKSLKGSSILILGIAYKADIDDVRESPALDIIERLRKAGAKVAFHDPYIGTLKIKGTALNGEPLDQATLSRADLVLLHTGHSSLDAAFIARNSRLILDTRNFFKGIEGPVVRL